MTKRQPPILHFLLGAAYQPPNIWEPVGFVGSNTSRYEQDHGAAL